MDIPKKELILKGNSKHLCNNYIDILKMFKSLKNINNHKLLTG